MSLPSPEPPDFAASQLFLRRLAFHLVRDEARAEDLVQETWATWVERRPGGLAEPRAWLARVLRNRAFNWKRDEDRRRRREHLAGAADASVPETGALEAQQRLVEALRALEEPYRSTLVQRYYHDLAPSAIAERAGAPLDTIKARLARGLARLRADMDRRYRGEREIWCHWLTVLGTEVLPVQSMPEARGYPGAPRAATPRTPWATLSGTALGKSVLFGILALCGLTWFLLRKERAPVSWAEPPSKTEPRERVATLAIPGREPTVAPRPAPTAEPEPEVPAVAPPAKTPFAPALPFDWPQLGGSASHLGLPDDAERRDQILVPRVRFTFAMLMGQPTVRGTELFAGGITLARVDLKSDEVHEPAPEIEKRIEESAHELRARSDAWAAVLRSQGFGGQARVAAAPALAGDYVLARMLGDGSVSAFDRELTYEAWRWEPSDPGPCPLSGSLAGDLFLVPHRREVVALRAPNGSVEWRFEVAEGDQVVQVPASDGDLVYFATERGVVYALELARGKERWRAAAPADPGWTLPLAFSDRLVLLALRRDAFSRSSRPSELRAFQSYDGRELWRKGQGVAANAGGSGGEVWLVERGLTSVSAETGQSLWSQNTNTLYWRELQVLRGAPKRVGDSLVALEDRDLLVVREVERGAVRWAYRANASLLDFVHAGEQIYLATDTGLLCLADDPAAKPEPPGHVYGRADPRDAYLFRP